MTANDNKTRKWSAADVPDQSGRVVVVTGANTGIGYHTAAVFADRGAHVVLAVRNLEKGNAARARIMAARPGAHVTLQQLDLCSLDSVRAAADALRTAYPRIDVLINNAGVMWTPKQVTKDGFELQFGTNHLGHFALTGLVLDHMLPVPGSRVVTVSSQGHRITLPSTSTTCSGNAVTTASPPTDKPNWLICCSPTSCNAGWAKRANPPSPSPLTLAAPTPS